MLHLEAALKRFSRLARVRANRFFPSSDCTFEGASVVAQSALVAITLRAISRSAQCD